MSDVSKWIGRHEQTQDVITRAGVDRYCATLGIAERSTVEKGAKQTELHVAPLGYHWCLCLPDAFTSELAEDGHPKKGGFLPPIELPRRMWAASKVEFIAELPIGATIVRDSRVLSIEEKNGKSGTLVFVNVEHKTSVDAQVAIKEQQTIVYREAAIDKMPLPTCDAQAPSDWQVVQEILPTQTLLFRYSALTFNSHRIHYDLPYTQEQEMYPELVVHGPLMASLVLQQAAKQGAVKEFSYRVQSAAFANQPLFIAANFDGNGESLSGGELATIGADGRRCLVAKVRY